ncbi:cell division protein FtsA, partial [Staphylococcus epidermidis]
AVVGNQDIYVGLDIGTTSIKVIVAEYIQGQMNIIGVGSQRSAGLSRGVIVDIDKAVMAIRQAVSQAEEKASIKIDSVVVGV